MAVRYVVKQGPLTFVLSTIPFVRDEEQTTTENMVEQLANRLAATEEVLKNFGYVIEKVDMPE
jgi:hypothetical protein